MKMKRLAAFVLSACMCLSFLAGCGSNQSTKESEEQTEAASTKESSGKKTLVIGDTTFNTSNEEPDVNPHNSYAGWACIR